jgi:hypothetical protein
MTMAPPPRSGEERRMRVQLGIAAIAASLTFAPACLAGPSTTAPSTRLTLVMRITDKGFGELAKYEWQGTDSLVPMARGVPVPRGDFATFTVINAGKRPHDFTILGRKTPKIAPGRRAHFNVLLKRRGRFTYSSTLDKGKAFRGFLTVI